MYPAVLVGEVVDQLGDEVHRHFLRLGLGGRLGWLAGGFAGAGWLRPVSAGGRRFGCLGAQEFGVDELVAGGDEGLGRLLFAEAVDGQAFLAQARGQAGEVAVAGDQAEAVEAPGVEQVHGVDDQRAVGGVLAPGVGELLDRLDGVVEQHLLPAAQLRAGPVAIDALDAGHAVFGDLFEQAFDDGGRRIVGVDQNGQMLLLPGGLGFEGHGSSLG
ncbi:hypothetical protein D3C85_606160 [compost metagenome]